MRTTFRTTSGIAALLATGLAGAAMVVPGRPLAVAGPPVGIEPIALQSGPYYFDTAEQHRIRVSVVTQGLKHPFAVAPLPNGDALVSERAGPLRLVHNAAGAGMQPPRLDPAAVTGLPVVTRPFGRGGLQDVVLHPQFAQNRLVYFTFIKADLASPPTPAGTSSPGGITSLWRGKLSASGLALTEVRELYTCDPGPAAGSRIAFGRDNFIYMTTGSAFDERPQQLGSAYGKVLRLHEDGTIPTDNPFVGHSGARPEIYSYGHRDQLGLAIHPGDGAVVAAEFGPNGGDELNLILPGRNYGWPLASFGRAYDGSRWLQSPVAPGTELPIVVWLPSISPHGLAFYDHDRFPNWKGNAFVAGARRGEIDHTGSLERIVFNDKLEELRREALLTELHQRLGGVRQGPDGLLYVLTDEDNGALLRIEPSGP